MRTTSLLECAGPSWFTGTSPSPARTVRAPVTYRGGLGSVSHSTFVSAAPHSAVTGALIASFDVPGTGANGYDNATSSAFSRRRGLLLKSSWAPCPLMRSPREDRRRRRPPGGQHSNRHRRLLDDPGRLCGDRDGFGGRSRDKHGRTRRLLAVAIVVTAVGLWGAVMAVNETAAKSLDVEHNKPKVHAPDDIARLPLRIGDLLAQTIREESCGAADDRMDGPSVPPL